MTKNLKNLIVFILSIVVMLSVIFIFLETAKPTSRIEEKGISAPVDPNISAPVDPSINGELLFDLGMGLFSTNDTSTFNGYVDTLIANRFTSLRIDIPNYQDAEWLARSKAAVISAIAKGTNVIWGVSSNSLTNSDYMITTENWPTYRQAILVAAAWAQANGVYEFQLGNEEEMHIWRHPVSIARTSNVATVTFKECHGFTVPHSVNIWGGSPISFNSASTTITVTGAKTFTYPSVGADGSVSNPESVYIGNISEGTIQANLKAVATEVKAIFTRGSISYTSSGAYYMEQWHSLGRGDIDKLGWSVYQNHVGWQHDINNMMSWWGAGHTYIAEFTLSYISLNSYSTDETAQTKALASMIEYIKASGITRAYYFCWNPGRYGVLKDNGTYRLLWSQALLKSNTQAKD